MLLFIPYCVAYEKSLNFLTPTGGENMQTFSKYLESKRIVLKQATYYLVWVSCQSTNSGLRRKGVVMVQNDSIAEIL